MDPEEILEDEDLFEPKDSEPWLSAIKQAEKQFDRWRHLSDRIDRIYSSLDRFNSLTGDSIVLDREFDIFWASVEVIKPSIYSRAPVPVVTPRFKDRSPVKRVTADLLERSAISAFEMTDIDQVMLGVRDDLVIVGRGQLWVTYEDEGDEKVCVEHLDRLDFLHDPARKWTEVCWVARRAWLSRPEMRERFSDRSGDLYLDANYSSKRDKDNTVYGADDQIEKAGVWEIWDRNKKKVVWVTEGCDKTLDEDEPHLRLKGFFPCPRPAYGTLQRRTLIPVPVIVRIQSQMESINLLTSRIHDLVTKLVVKGIVPSGTDIGDAVEAAMREEDVSHMLIPVPALSMSQGGALVEWLPIDQVANTILAAVQARRELIGNVQELLGIADIMRGDTDAQETLGAQQLKAQYGSVRVRDMINELVRVARDAVCIMSEIMAEEFSLDSLLKMAQMELPTESMIKKQIKDIGEQAKQQLTQLEEQAAQAIEGQAGQEPDPEQMQAAQQQLQQAQQQIIQQSSQAIQKLSQAVTEEQVRKLLKDTKTDPFMFDIETDSTIYPDEQAEKQARNEFMTAFTTAAQALAPLVQTGPEGAKMAGELIKFQLAPYRSGRQLEGMIDEWVDSLANAPQGGGDEAADSLAASQMALAEAEAAKARAQMAKVEADSQLKQAELQTRMQQMQIDTQEKQAKLQLENSKLQLQASKQEQEFAAKMADMDAKQNLMQAQTAEILSKIGLDARKQDLEEYRAATDTQFRAEDQARAAETTAFDQEQRIVDGQRQEQTTDRQMTLAEQQAMERGDA